MWDQRDHKGTCTEDDGRHGQQRVPYEYDAVSGRAPKTPHILRVDRLCGKALHAGETGYLPNGARTAVRPVYWFFLYEMSPMLAEDAGER